MPEKETKKDEKAPKNADDKELTLDNDKKYLYAVGRRKTSIAQVRVYTKGKGKIEINDEDLDKYFPTYNRQYIVTHALKLIGQDDKT